MGADGTVCVGPLSHRGGLISRRSQLRDLRKQISELEGNLDSRAAVAERLEGEVADAVARLEVAGDTKQDFQRQADEGSRERTATEQQKKQQDEQHLVTSAEWGRARAGRDAVSADLALFRDRRKENEAELVASRWRAWWSALSKKCP